MNADADTVQYGATPPKSKSKEHPPTIVTVTCSELSAMPPSIWRKRAYNMVISTIVEI